MANWERCPWFVRHLFVAIAYGLAYFALVSVSETYWWPSAGLRFACLLIFPYRYWPALLVGELTPLVYQSIQCLDQFGLTWALTHSFPAIVWAMPVVKWFRDQHQIDRPPFAASMSALLMAAVIVSATIAAVNTAAFPLMHLPAGYKAPSLLTIGGWHFLGYFLGTLTVVPAVLVIREVAASDAWHLSAHRPLPRQAAWEGLAIAMIFAVLVITGHGAQDATIRYAINAAFVCSVMWLVFRHGWQGAAYGCVIASIAIILLPHVAYDPGTILALSTLTFTVMVMLLLGAKTSQLQLALREHQLLARQELYLNEVKRRRNAHILDRLHTMLSMAHSRVLNRLRFFLAPGEETSYREQLDEVRDRLGRLRETLSPREWQRLGHPNALQETVGHALNQLGIAYEADLRGTLSRLTPDLAVTLYRLGCEALVFLLMHHPTDLICLQTSTHTLANGKIEVTLAMTSEGHAIAPPPREKLLAALGANGLGETDIRSRAKLYAGVMLIDTLPGGAARITLKLRDGADSIG